MFSNFSGGRQGVSIFNRRRRPRQAVYAPPQSQNPTTPLQIDIPDEALLEIAEDFENSPKNYHHFALNNKPGVSYQNTRPSSQNRQLSGPLKHPNNQIHGSEHALTKKPKLEQGNYFGEKNESIFRQQQTNPASYSITNTRNPFSSKFESSTKRTFSFVDKNTINKPQQSYSSQKADYSWNNTNYGTNSPAKATTAGRNARQPRVGERASFGAPMTMVNKNIKKESPFAKNDINVGETGFTLQTVDKTMKFVTSTIQGVRKWNEYRDQIPLVFEIFVALDSVPTSNNNGTAKLFNIRDSTGSSRCIYWEMVGRFFELCHNCDEIAVNSLTHNDIQQDQKLPRMARGQTYRLVGALERKTGHFQCFTIRPAQLNEQRLAKQQVQMCNDAMTKLIAMISES